MKKTLVIEALVIMARLGLHDFEKKHVQPVLMDLEIACKSTGQALEKSQDYSYIGHLIQSHVKAKDYDLVESLSEDVWEVLLINQVWVNRLKVTKLNPPCYQSRVKIERVSHVISR